MQNYEIGVAGVTGILDSIGVVWTVVAFAYSACLGALSVLPDTPDGEVG